MDEGQAASEKTRLQLSEHRAPPFNSHHLAIFLIGGLSLLGEACPRYQINGHRGLEQNSHKNVAFISSHKQYVPLL